MSTTAKDYTLNKRAYDARSRRQRAEHERADTRDRVLTAARARFLAEGYAGTKMLDIAHDAGVAIASVYRAGSSKAELIETILWQATVDEDEARAAGESPTFADLGPPSFPAIAAEPDPRQQVRMMADLSAHAADRVGPLWTVLRDAASVDAHAAETMRSSLDRRGVSFEVVVGLLPVERLRASPTETVDALWALTSLESYLMLRTVRGWSHERYRDWLRRTLLLHLLKPAVDDPPDEPCA